MEKNTVTYNLRVEGKNMVVAYLLWWFLGWAGVHRFYLGKIPSGAIQLTLFLVGWSTLIFFVGFLFLAIWGIWWLLDAYFVQKYVTDYNETLGFAATSFIVDATTHSGQSQSKEQLAELEKLFELYEKGAITKEEYESKKGKLL